jgi:hypothetical protein
MLPNALTGSQREALGRLLSAVELHETELRGSLPGARSKISHVGQPLAGALRDILDALGLCKKAGV